MVKNFLFFSGLILGLFIPGGLLSLILLHRIELLTSFIASFIILFYAIFISGLLSIPITFFSIFMFLLALTIILSLIATKKGLMRVAWNQFVTSPISFPAKRETLIFAGIALCITVLFIYRLWAMPLSGFDTPWRWNFLSQQMLDFKNFDFYPPVRSMDFYKYSYPDAIPPLVSFIYWWIYSAAQNSDPLLSILFVLIQFFLCSYGTYVLSNVLCSTQAAIFALGFLLSSSIFFGSLFMSQEIGCIALATVSLFYFLIMAKKNDSLGFVASAGMAAGMGILSREYGFILIFLGLLALIWLRLGYKFILIFLILAIFTGSPWYIRSFFLTGNPFYSLNVGGIFAMNKVYNEIMISYSALLGPNRFSSEIITFIIQSIYYGASAHFTIGIAAGLYFFKRTGYLFISALILMAIWFYSMNFTAGGYLYALRVLAPSICLLSVLAGIFFHKTVDNINLPKWMYIFLFFLMIRSFIYDITYPIHPFKIPFSKWYRSSLAPRDAFDPRRGLSTIAEKLFPANSKILCDEAYSAAALSKSTIKAVSIFSPEVDFIFKSMNTPADTIKITLIRNHVLGILYSVKGINSFYLSRFDFYKNGPQKWKKLARFEDYILYRF